VTNAIFFASALCHESALASSRQAHHDNENIVRAVFHGASQQLSSEFWGKLLPDRGDNADGSIFRIICGRHTCDNLGLKITACIQTAI
jgi:hypothetical protein